MEKFMKNEILQPVIETLQYKVNSTLGEFAKAFIERSDFEALGLIAKIGESTTSYFDGLSSIIHYDEESVVTIDAPDVVEAEQPTKPKQPIEPKEYSVNEKDLMNWIYNYVGSRGGKALKDDLSNAFYNEFSSGFNAYDLTLSKDNKFKWKQNIAHRVSDLRVDGILEPSIAGETYHYYILTPKYLALYKTQVAKIEEQLSLPDLEITG
jgi:hypothetical protein